VNVGSLRRTVSCYFLRCLIVSPVPNVSEFASCPSLRDVPFGGFSAEGQGGSRVPLALKIRSVSQNRPKPTFIYSIREGPAVHYKSLTRERSSRQPTEPAELLMDMWTILSQSRYGIIWSKETQRFKRCGSLFFKDNREQNIGVRRSLTLQCPDSIQNGILLFLSDINEVHRSRVLCARRSSAFNFMRETNHEKQCPILGLLKLRGLRAAAISLIATEDFVLAEEFGQIYSLCNL
jgi:hypothetical protein